MVKPINSKAPNLKLASLLDKCFMAGIFLQILRSFSEQQSFRTSEDSL